VKPETMSKEIVRINPQALAIFNKTLELANKLQDENEHHDAEWFDTPEKRIQWWFDLEPQWRQAFVEAAFMYKRLKGKENYTPSDKELKHLFQMKQFEVCGEGEFENRNNYPVITFQLTNLTGLTNLTHLERVECDYNGQIESLEPLRHLKKLQTLWCDNNRISDLSPLIGLPYLTALCCWNNQISNIEALTAMPQLRDLTFGLYNQGNPIEDFSPIGQLSELRYLQLNACGVKNLNFLKPCKTLRHLTIMYNDIKSVKGYEHLIRRW
jgi:hypothetical protein